MEEKIIQLKITLDHTKPPVWRRVLVKSSITFHELHFTIQIAMGWESTHLYEFTVDNYRIGRINEEFDDQDSKLIDAREIKLDETLLNGEIEEFSYLYDFGDSWEHTILVEEVLDKDPEQYYPVCIKGNLNCPPEDCGGIPGFYDLLKVLKNKRTREYKEIKEWLGYEYNPAQFDLEEVNFYLEEIDEEMEESEGWESGNFSGEEDDFEDEDFDFLDLFAEIKIRVVNKSRHALPNYESDASAGMDLRANLDEKITLQPLERTIVKTGLFIELPIGFEAQVRPRSGLAAKKGITVLNAPGTIDADYRGEIGVILVNLSNEAYTIEDGERIAQLVIARHERAEWTEVDKLNETKRGEGGFGSTGNK